MTCRKDQKIANSHDAVCNSRSERNPHTKLAGYHLVDLPCHGNAVYWLKVPVRIYSCTLIYKKYTTEY